MKIFPVAPELKDLPSIDTELAAIATRHEIVPDPPLIGYVTSDDVAHEVNKTDCDVILWMCHGGDEGLLLSNDELIDADLVTQFVRDSKATLCVFNACRSEHLARRVFYSCQIDVIYARRDVEDKKAALYMTSLSEALALSNSYTDAYRRVGSQGGTYRHLAANEDGMNRQADTNEMRELMRAFYDHRSATLADIAALKQRSEVAERQIAVMERHMETMNRQIEAIDRQTEVLQSVPRVEAVSPVFVWLFGIFLVGIAIMLVWILVRGGA